MNKLDMIDPIFLCLKHLGSFSFLAIIDADGIIVTRADEEFSYSLAEEM
jgi:hypothetical protein